MTVTEKRRIGDIGEEVSCRHLRNKGFSILEQNYLKKWGEIDVIARKKGKYHFIEVKTVQTTVPRETSSDVVSHENNEFRPEDNVHKKKLQRLYRTIQSYLVENNVPRETDWQIDVITVKLDLDSKQAKVELIDNVIID